MIFIQPRSLETFVYWMTSSARSSSDCGIGRPSALAVLRLITSSNFVGCSTGRSAGLRALQDLVNVVRGERPEEIWPIGHEQASFGIDVAIGHGGKPIPHGKRRAESVRSRYADAPIRCA